MKRRVKKLTGLIFFLFLPPYLLLLVSWRNTPDAQPIEAKIGFLIGRSEVNNPPDKRSISPGRHDWAFDPSDQRFTAVPTPPSEVFLRVFYSPVTCETPQEAIQGSQAPGRRWRVLSARELQQVTRNPLSRLTPIFTVKYVDYYIYGMVQDIDRNGVADIILRIAEDKRDWTTLHTLAYEVVDGKPRYLFAYTLEQPLRGEAIDLIALPALDYLDPAGHGTVKLRVFQPFRETSVIQFDAATGKYTKTRLSWLKLFPLWPLAVHSILAPLTNLFFLHSSLIDLDLT